MNLSVCLILHDNSSYYSQDWISNIDCKKLGITGFLIDTESNGEVKSTSPYPTYPASIFVAEIPTVHIYSISNSGHQGEMLIHGEV